MKQNIYEAGIRKKKNKNLSCIVSALLLFNYMISLSLKLWLLDFDQDRIKVITF